MFLAGPAKPAGLKQLVARFMDRERSRGAPSEQARAGPSARPSAADAREIRTPGQRVAIEPNGPLTSAGASGLGSQVSSWLGPPTRARGSRTVPALPRHAARASIEPIPHASEPRPAANAAQKITAAHPMPVDAGFGPLRS